MLNKSGAARTVMDAVATQLKTDWISTRVVPYEAKIAAAALRAAALYCQQDSIRLLAVADELEGE